MKTRLVFAIGLSTVLIGFPSMAQKKVQSLPNGNYRFCQKNHSFSEEYLHYRHCFLFRKIGNNIIGNYSSVEQETTVCIQGQVNNNTVSGQAAFLAFVDNAYSNESDFTNSTLKPFLSEYLQVGRERVTRSYHSSLQDYANEIRYHRTLLNLNGFERVNAGQYLPPSNCNPENLSFSV